MTDRQTDDRQADSQGKIRHFIKFGCVFTVCYGKLLYISLYKA